MRLKYSSSFVVYLSVNNLVYMRWSVQDFVLHAYGFSYSLGYMRTLCTRGVMWRYPFWTYGPYISDASIFAVRKGGGKLTWHRL